MPRFTVLHGERQEGRRENGEDADVKKYVEMLTQAGFETAVSHVQRSAQRFTSWRQGPSLRKMMLGDTPLFDRKPLYTQRQTPQSEEEKAASDPSQ